MHRSRASFQNAMLRGEREAYEQRLADLREKNQQIIQKADARSIDNYLQTVQGRFLARGKVI